MCRSMWYLSQWHQRVTGWGHRNAVSSEGFEPLVTPYIHTHTPMLCCYIYRSQTHTLVRVHPSSRHYNTCVPLFNGDLAWPSCVVGFVAISNTAKKIHPELLIGLGLICNHRKGKERTLSCATAINNPQTCIIYHEQELGASLLRWR